MKLHRISESSSGYMSFGNQELGSLLETHWDQLQIETIKGHSQTLQAKIARLHSIAREMQIRSPDEFAVIQ